VRQQRLLSIQYLRAVAALSILLFHLTLRYGAATPISSFRTDLFFIMSGFILWVITVDRPANPGEFLLKRIIRIVPHYWLATVATALLILIKPNFTYGHQLDVFRFIGSLVFFPTLAGDRILPVVLQAWPLVYEMMFYLLFAMSLFVRQAFRPYVLASMLCTLMACHLSTTEPHIVAATNPNIIGEFLAGILLGVLWTNCVLPPRTAAAVFFVGILSLMLAEYYQISAVPALRAGIPSLLVVAGAAFYEKTQRVVQISLMRVLGDASYSIFIWHVFVSIILHGLLLRTHFPVQLQFVIEVIGTIFFCCVIYITLERPLNDALRRLFAARSAQHAAPQLP